MSVDALVALGLLALAGFLVGGVYAAWRSAKLIAGVLSLLALLALGGAFVWLQ